MCDGGGAEPVPVPMAGVAERAATMFGLTAASGLWPVAADWVEESGSRPDEVTAAAMRGGFYTPVMDDGYGDGDGSGSGSGYGYGSGSGSGSGDGSGDGYGDGSGSGSGDGYGDGDGSGSGSG